MISEGFRISSSVAGRLVRINRTAAIEYKSYILPSGPAVSMSIRDSHFDESIFPDAHRVKPEPYRGEDRRALGKHLLSFGKSPRNCVGMNLAVAELHLVIRNLFRRYDMEFVDTRERYMAMAHCFFSPFAPVPSQGLRVAVTITPTPFCSAARDAFPSIAWCTETLPAFLTASCVRVHQHGAIMSYSCSNCTMIMPN